MDRLALIVDDDPVLQKAMSGHLERLKFEVVRAEHYSAAVALLGARKPDFVCVNLELPTQSGYELCEYIRGALGLRQVPILATSSSRLARDMASAEQAGASAFLKKPFTMRELSTCMEALLGNRARRTAPGQRPRS